MKKLIKFKDTPEARKFATKYDLFFDKWFMISYSDDKNYYVNDGGAMQEVPKHLVEVKNVTPENEGLAQNGRLLFG